MKLLDLFSGGKSVTRVAESLGYTVTTLDINKNYQPDIIANVLDFDYQSHLRRRGIPPSPPSPRSPNVLRAPSPELGLESLELNLLDLKLL